MTEIRYCKNCKHLSTDGFCGLICNVSGDNRKYDCSKYESKDGGDEVNNIDDWTLHCVNWEIKRLIEFNDKLKADAIERRNEVEYLIFQNRILVLVELQHKLKLLKNKDLKDICGDKNE